VASQGWVSLLNPGITPTGPGLTFTESATTAVISPQLSGATADYAVVNAAGQPYGWQAGMLVYVFARGWITTSATTGTLTVFLRANKGNAGSTFVTLATPVGVTTGAGSLTGIQFNVEALIRCTAVAGTGSTLATQGEWNILNSGAGVPANPIALTGSGGLSLPMPNISGETASSVDTTQPQGIQLCATATAASGTIACTQWLVETLD
jgi:hypothetical protein